MEHGGVGRRGGGWVNGIMAIMPLSGSSDTINFPTLLWQSLVSAADGSCV